MLSFKTKETAPLVPWRRVEKYQNSTLRFTPGEDFPPHLESRIGRPLIMRCFVTLNDVWDYRTDEYFYDFTIGDDRYNNDPSMPVYDRDESKLSPYKLTYMQYLKSHADHADELFFSIRRYEREVKSGRLAIEKYEEVVENVLEYYKARVPNIRYIECNEPDCWQFGDMKPFEFYQLYKCLYKIVNRLNKRHGYDLPLLLGGPCFADHSHALNEEFLRLYALDRDPNKRLDFYSAHAYTTSRTVIPEFYNWLKKTLAALNLPDIPLHFNEYGAGNMSPDRFQNQISAAISLAMQIAVSDIPDLYVYPWCSYHDPDIQVDRTQYIDFNRTTEYLPTFLGQAYIALSRLLEYRVSVEGNLNDKGVVTTDGNKYAVIVTNPSDKPENVRFVLSNINKSKVRVKVYTVDTQHNNCFIDHNVHDLYETDGFEADVIDGEITLDQDLEAYAFTMWMIE